MASARRRLLGEWIRFCCVGALSAALNMGIIVVLTEVFGLHYIGSTILCSICVNIVGFVGNRNWSFRLDTAFRWGEPVRYTLVALGGLLLTIWLSRIMVQAGLPYYAAVYGAAILLAPYNFICHRCLTFRVPALSPGT